MPAAAVTACCSAMPTSMHRSGNRSRKEETGGVGHGGGDRHELGVLVAELHEGLGERCGVGPVLAAPPLSARPLGIVHRLDLVLFGGSESLALLGEHMDDDRPVELGGVLEGLFHRGDVVTVEGPCSGRRDPRRTPTAHISRTAAFDMRTPRPICSPTQGMRSAISSILAWRRI